MYLPDVLTIARVYSDYFSIGTGCKRYLSYGNWRREFGSIGLFIDLKGNDSSAGTGDQNQRHGKLTELVAPSECL